MKKRVVLASVIAAGLQVCASAKKGEEKAYADDQGRLVFFESGTPSALVDGLKSGSAEKSDWGTEPLGAPGDISKDEVSFTKKPVYRKAPVFSPGIRFWGKGVSGCVVSADSATRSIAEELAWHLSKMCGKKVRCVNTVPAADVPVIVVGGKVDPAARTGESVIASKGTRMDVTGHGSGIPYAVTYLLEAIGCRYLWPGVTGKIIPAKPEIVLPDLNWRYVPALKKREMRDYGAMERYNPRQGKALMEAWGIDGERFMASLISNRYDRAGNRDFFRWHGVNDASDLSGSWSSAHKFMDYWKKYSETHPDWFGMQPNGSRHQALGNLPDRNTLCLANRGLREHIAREAVEVFKRRKDVTAYSLGLPDGGYMSQCMCSKCRALDPVNAYPEKFQVVRPKPHEFDYVCLTDRVLDFSNWIAEYVTREVPSAKFGYSIYSLYGKPPVKVKPHPSLVLWSVIGSVITKEDRESSQKSLAKWSGFGNQLIWRPNTFMHYRGNAPQNFARFVFEDLEIFKRNNLIGTDFDCVNHQFATRGIMWYVTAKAHRNPDEIGYDDIVDDYCAVGFGRAAKDVRAYFDALERITDRATELGKGLESFIEAFDPVMLDSILTKAERAAAGDDTVLKRLAFLRLGLVAGTFEKRLGCAWAVKDRAAILSIQNEYKLFMQSCAYPHPFAVNPLYVTSYWSRYQMRHPRF